MAFVLIYQDVYEMIPCRQIFKAGDQTYLYSHFSML